MRIQNLPVLGSFISGSFIFGSFIFAAVCVSLGLPLEAKAQCDGATRVKNLKTFFASVESEKQYGDLLKKSLLTVDQKRLLATGLAEVGYLPKIKNLTEKGFELHVNDHIDRDIKIEILNSSSSLLKVNGEKATLDLDNSLEPSLKNIAKHTTDRELAQRAKQPPVTGEVALEYQAIPYPVGLAAAVASYLMCQETTAEFFENGQKTPIDARHSPPFKKPAPTQ